MFFCVIVLSSSFEKEKRGKAQDQVGITRSSVTVASRQEPDKFVGK